jgi:hypothetical protein
MAASGKKPSSRVAVSSARVSSLRSEPPINLAPRLAMTSGTSLSEASLSSASLARAAGVGQRPQLPGVGLDALGAELAGDGKSQRQIHVVATEQDVLADRDPVQFEDARAFENGNQREVAGAAADVGDEDDLARLHLLAPAAAALLNPAVQRSLRLFEQDHVLRSPPPWPLRHSIRVPPDQRRPGW